MSLTALLRAALPPPPRATHWSSPGLKHLTEAFFWVDVLGLRGLGLPFDEYQPEAELAFALAMGCNEIRELWSKPYSRPACLGSDIEIMSIVKQSFSRMFGQDFDLPESLAYDFREAFQVCESEEACKGHWSRVGVSHLSEFFASRGTSEFTHEQYEEDARLVLAVVLGRTSSLDIWDRKFDRPTCLASQEDVLQVLRAGLRHDELSLGFRRRIRLDEQLAEAVIDAFDLCEREVVCGRAGDRNTETPAGEAA